MILESAPEGAKVLDLAGSRAARTELHAGEPYPVVKLQAGFVELQREVDLTAADDFTEGRFRAGLTKLLVDPADIDALLQGGFSRADLDSITSFVTGRTVGE